MNKSVHEYIGDILKTLESGPVVRWHGGSNRERDTALRHLRERGLIRYRKVADGGRGWELNPEAASS